DGFQSRDFTYVANVVHANLIACTTPGIAGEVFNIACGDRITVNSMLEQINKIAGTNVTAVHEGTRAGDILHSQADISRAREKMGFEPTTSFETGLRHTIDWYRKDLKV